MKPLIKGSVLISRPGESITGGVTIEGPIKLKPRKLNKVLKREFKHLRMEMMREVKK